MRAVVISTGDELTTGRTLDTNAHYLADHLVGVGIDVVAMLVVGDYPDRIAWAWRTALQRADLIICTGASPILRGMENAADCPAANTVSNRAIAAWSVKPCWVVRTTWKPSGAAM